jgi:hypothetical protein
MAIMGRTTNAVRDNPEVAAEPSCEVVVVIGSALDDPDVITVVVMVWVEVVVVVAGGRVTVEVEVWVVVEVDVDVEVDVVVTGRGWVVFV